MWRVFVFTGALLLLLVAIGPNVDMTSRKHANRDIVGEKAAFAEVLRAHNRGKCLWAALSRGEFPQMQATWFHGTPKAAQHWEGDRQRDMAMSEQVCTGVLAASFRDHPAFFAGVSAKDSDPEGQRR